LLRFIISAFTVCILLSLIILLGVPQGGWQQPDHWMGILVFVLFITLITYVYLVKLRSKRPHLFVQFYLLSIVIKMSASLAYIFLVAASSPSGATANVVVFLSAYGALTLLEVYFLMVKK
jgi:hypothetical protein